MVRTGIKVSVVTLLSVANLSGTPAPSAVVDGGSQSVGFQLGDLVQLRDQIGRQLETGDFAAAEAATQSVLARVDSSGADPATAQTIRSYFETVLSLIYINQFRFADAEQLRMRSAENAVRVIGPNNPRALAALNNLASLYLDEGRYQEAEPLLSRVFASLPQRSDTAEGTELLTGEADWPLIVTNNLANAYAALGRITQAEVLFRRLVTATGWLDDRARIAALQNYASFLRNQRRFREAEEWFRRARLDANTIYGAADPTTLTSQMYLADFLMLQGRFDEALPDLRAAVSTSTATFGADDPLTSAAVDALVHGELSAGTPSRQTLDSSRRIIAFLRGRRAVGEANPFYSAQAPREQALASRSFLDFANAAWAESSLHPANSQVLTSEAFTALQDAIGGAADLAMRHMAIQRFASSSPRIVELVRRRELLEARWRFQNASLNASLADFGPGSRDDRTSIRGQINLIENQLAEIDLELRRDFPAYFNLIRPEAIGLGELQRSLGDDEGLLFVVPSGLGTHVFGISKTQFQWVRSSMNEGQVRSTVDHLLRNITETMAGRDYRYSRGDALRLYQDIVLPVEHVFDGKQRLVVVGAGSLSALPFGALVTRAPEGTDEDPQTLRATSWFADSYAIAQLPSIQSLAFLRRFAAPQNVPGHAFVGIGNPRLEGPPDRATACGARSGSDEQLSSSVINARPGNGGRMVADVARLRQLCPLPGTERELTDLRTALGSESAELLLQQDANEPRVRSMDLSRAAIIAFATHGIVAGEFPGVSEPGLVLTPPTAGSERDDGYLTASEVTTLRLNADWVILSACKTATGEYVGAAPGLSALSRAFFYAGARSLLASHWNIADNAAARLTVRTIQFATTAPGLSRAEALQRAMREVREDPAHPEWAHPGVWAPFSLIGGGD